MSDTNAVAAVTAVLTHILGDVVGNAVENAKLSHVRPDDVPDGQDVVNIYCYGVSRNASLANAALPWRAPDGTVRNKPLLALDIEYLFTFHGKDSHLEPQRLMGAVATTLNAHPVLGPTTIQTAIDNLSTENEYKDWIGDCDLAEQVPAIRIVPVPMDLEQMSKLWSVFFQTAYELSVAYQVSVVLMEAPLLVDEALPVRTRALSVTTTRSPRIEGLSAVGGALISGATLVITGGALKGDVTRVLIDGSEVATTKVTDEAIELTLAGLSAGPHSVVVQHPIQRDDGTVLPFGTESNTAAFALQPTVSATSTATTLTATIAPAVTAGQTVRIVINSTSGSGESLSAELPSPSAPTTSFDVDVSGVTAGSYLIRASVDGTSSPLSHDGSAFTGPTVTVPA